MSRSVSQQFAGHYLNLGLSVVPLLPRAKKCVVDDWSGRTFGVDDFDANANVGVCSVRGIVVVDDDFDQNAVACMDDFLPKTSATYGRPQKPRGKRLYYCPDLTKTKTFTDLKGEHRLQLRVGLQDMAPPSIHPDTGERLRWDGLLLSPAKVSQEDLVAAARLAWCARLMATYWPPEGRHEARLAWSRVLLETFELSDDTAIRVLEWACRLGGSDAKGIADVRGAVQSTRDRLTAGESSIGANRLAELMPEHGRQLVKLLRKEFNPSLILNPNDPLPSARVFVAKQHTIENVATLQHQHSVFYTYDSAVGAYHEREDAAVRAELYRFLEKSHRPSEKDTDDPPPFQPTRSKVENVLDALRAVSNLPETHRAPCWLKTPNVSLDPLDMLACPNGLLHIPTRRLYDPSPHFFTLNGIEFTYDTHAPEPREWLAFLKSIWPDDAESRDTVQEMFGYFLTPETRQQKVFMLVGPPRSGKGVMGRVLRRLIGERNTCSPTLASFGRDFGKQVLVGKTLAVISDARISGRTDTAVVAETLLSISGEDAQTVERKFLPDWNGKLAVRFLLLTNELPRLGDVSGALAKRFIVLALTESFYGKEDMSLFDRLVPELPGILNWALEGRDRLAARGHFVQPKSAADLMQDFADLGSPEATFLREFTERQPLATVAQEDLFAAWKLWAGENGRDHVGTAQTFARNVRAVMPDLRVCKIGGRGEQKRYWEGLRLSMPGTDNRPDHVPGGM